MAICKMCHKVIPDGRDFCDECEIKRTNQADESYLDRLLSSVSSDSEPEPRRRRDESSEKPEERPSMADIIADVIAEEKENRENKETPIIDEPVFGDTPASEEISFDDVPLGDEVSFDDTPVSDDISFDEAPVGDDISFDDAPVSDDISFDDTPLTDEPVFDVDDAPLTDEPAFDVDDAPLTDEPIFDVDDSLQPEEATSEPEDELASFGSDPPSEIDSMITDLLSEMPEDTPEEEKEFLDQDDIASIFSQQEEAESDSDIAEIEDVPDLSVDDAPADESDLLSVEEPEMVDPFGGDIAPSDVTEEPEMVDPFGGDITPSAESEEPEVQFVNPGDEPAEENVLGADELFALDDSTISEADLISIGTDEPEPVDIMAEIESGALEDKIKALDAPQKDETTKKKKKKSLFQRLFGNVVEELTEEQKEARRLKAEEEEKQRIAIAEAKKKGAEEAKAAKAAQKELDKAEAEEKKKQAEEAKRKAKEEAREKARKKKEAREALEISEEDEGKINKVGAGILFILFGVIAAFIILGTNTYTYNLSIENAQTDFLIRHYNEAYYDVYGLTIKDEDIELYDRIMTVMYVNSQLNSYNYYMTSNNRDKALNSLIKGLEKYEKYYMLATTLNITDDLEYVKTNILNELNKTFKLTEEEAYAMMNINDVVDYSEYIYALLGTYDLESLKSLT